MQEIFSCVSYNLNIFYIYNILADIFTDIFTDILSVQSVRFYPYCMIDSYCYNSILDTIISSCGELVAVDIDGNRTHCS
jgi:hypothetical protein